MRIFQCYFDHWRASHKYNGESIEVTVFFFFKWNVMTLNFKAWHKFVNGNFNEK